MHRGSISWPGRPVRARRSPLAGVVAVAVSTLVLGEVVDADVAFVQVGAIGGEFDHEAGSAVSLSADGSRIAIGAPGGSGHVRVYNWDGNAWTQTGGVIVGEAAGDGTGVAVSLSADGSRVAVGAPRSDCGRSDVGKVRVFDWDGAAWAQTGADLCGVGTRVRFGSDVALSADGARLAVGAPGEIQCGPGPEPVRVYEWDGAGWAQTGADIAGEPDAVRFGSSVALSADGNRLAIGTPSQSGTLMCDPDRRGSGHTRVFDWDGTTWTQAGTDIAGEPDDHRAWVAVSMSADGNRVAIGAAGWDTGIGRVRVVDWGGSAWVAAGADIEGEPASDAAGYAVALSTDGSRLVVGFPFADRRGCTGVGPGLARVFDWDATIWTQVGADIVGQECGDNAGRAVALSADGRRMAIGSPHHHGSGFWAGQVWIYDITAAPTTTTTTPTTSTTTTSTTAPATTSTTTTSTTVPATTSTTAPTTTVGAGGALPATGTGGGATLIAAVLGTSGLALIFAARRRTP